MSEDKESPFKVPPGAHSPESLEPDEVDAAKRVLDETVQLTAIPEDPLAGPTDVYDDIGGGDRRKRFLDRMKADITNGLFEIDEKYLTPHPDDRAIYALHRSIGSIKDLSDTPGMSIELFVSQSVQSYAKGGEQNKRNEATRLHDSLGLLKNALEFADTSDSEERDEQFRHVAKSELWNDKTLNTVLTRAIVDARNLIAYMSSSDPKSIEAFLTKFRYQIMRELGFKTPERGASASTKEKYKRHVGNLSVQAWRDWKETVDRGDEDENPEFKPPDLRVL
jgi:hypothetical protein